MTPVTATELADLLTNTANVLESRWVVQAAAAAGATSFTVVIGTTNSNPANAVVPLVLASDAANFVGARVLFWINQTPVLGQNGLNLGVSTTIQSVTTTQGPPPVTTVTVNDPVPYALAPGDQLIIFRPLRVEVTAPENIAEVGGQAVPSVGGVPSVPVTVEGTPTVDVGNFPTTQTVSGTVTANQGAAGTSAWPQNLTQVGGTAVPTVNGVPSVPVTAGLVLADTVAPGTAAAATTPILLTYGSPAAHYTVPAHGTVNVAVALSAAATLTVSHNASAASPSYNALNGDAALAATAEYAFSIPVKQGDVVDFEVSAAVTLNVFTVWFTPHQ